MINRKCAFIMPKMTVKYPTRPLEYFPKMKELRRSIAKDTFAAQERGKPVILGGEGGVHAIYAAFDAEVLPAMPTGREMRDLDWVIQLNQAAEDRGFGRDCCATLRIALGAHFMETFGKNIKTGKQLRPDVVVNLLLCQGQAKSHQLHADFLGIPNINIELPFLVHNIDLAKKYFVNQCHSAVENLEQILNRKCDNEKLIAGTKIELQNRKLMSKIALLQKTVPAPLKQRHLCSLMAFQFRGVTHRPDVARFYELVLDEVTKRVDDGIAACENEKFRLFHEGSLPWYTKLGDILRYPENFGGIYIGSLNNFGISGSFIINEQGDWEEAPLPWEIGCDIKTRDDAFNALADAFLLYSPFCQLFRRPEFRLSAARSWNADGIVFAIDRGCVGITSGLYESSIVAKKAGLRAISYETSCTYPPDLDEKGYYSLIDTLMETLEYSK